MTQLEEPTRLSVSKAFSSEENAQGKQAKKRAGKDLPRLRVQCSFFTPSCGTCPDPGVKSDSYLLVPYGHVQTRAYMWFESLQTAHGTHAPIHCAINSQHSTKN